MLILPRYVFLTKGVGIHRERLASFEVALRDAGIAPYNLVRVSSIFPPYCRIISRARGLSLLKPGQVLFVVMSDNATNEPHRLISASIGIAIPKDPSRYGYLSEYHSFGEREEKAGDYAE
ncbi:MAG: arginine decarboxylase, pyruvoyl-dependent, partial [candidate division WOR-3 bacterium]